VQLLLLTATESPRAVLPALALLPHQVQVADPTTAAALDTRTYDAVLVDAAPDPVAARAVCRLLGGLDPHVPVVAVLGENALLTLTREWAVDGVLLVESGPVEVDARLRVLLGRAARSHGSACGALVIGDLVVDGAAYSARLCGQALDLTCTEFELLHVLAQEPDRVFTRDRLLREVWGTDRFGGNRTVDVHVRRLRSKLGAEHEKMIATVRSVGYKLVCPPTVVSAQRPANRPTAVLPT
jgi:DNA-binding response OmpR family regulator